MLSVSSLDKNRDWFADLAKEHNKFDKWYIGLDERGNIVAFSAIRKIGENYRLLSRLWYDEDYRVGGLKTPLIEDTPAMMMAKLQLEDYPVRRFCSMEYPTRRGHLRKVATRLNERFGTKFKLNDGMHLTCKQENSFSCWQNTISEDELDLPSITVEEWRERFGNQRKVFD